MAIFHERSLRRSGGIAVSLLLSLLLAATTTANGSPAALLDPQSSGDLSGAATTAVRGLKMVATDTETADAPQTASVGGDEEEVTPTAALVPGPDAEVPDLDLETDALMETEQSPAPGQEPSGELSEEIEMELSDELAGEEAEGPIVEPSVEPAEELSEELAEELSVEPAEEPSVEPAEELSEELVEEPSVEPDVEPLIELAMEPSTEPAEEPSLELVEEELGTPIPEISPTVEEQDIENDEPMAELEETAPLPEPEEGADGPIPEQEATGVVGAGDEVNDPEELEVEEMGDAQAINDEAEEIEPIEDDDGAKGAMELVWPTVLGTTVLALLLS